MHIRMIVLFFIFHWYFILYSDEVIPPSSQPPAPPERKIASSQPAAVTPAAAPNPPLTRSLYKTLRSTFKPFSSSSSKKLNHAQSTPDLSVLVSENKNDDETSSSLENLSKAYATTNLSQQRPTGSILKRRPQPSAISSQIQEEPVYVSSVSVPLQKGSARSVQSMIRDQDANIPER